MISAVLVYAVAVPLLTAAACALLTRRGEISPHICWALGVGVGYVAGQLGLKSQSGLGPALESFFNPTEVRQWVPHAVLLAIAATILAHYAPPTWKRGVTALAALLTFGVPIRLLSGNVAQQLSLAGKISCLVLLPGLLGLAWFLLNRADEGQPFLRPVLTATVAAGAAIAIALSGSLTTGQLCGATATAIGGTALAMFAPELLRGRQRKTFGFRGAAGVITLSLGSLLILAHFYSELSAASAALILIALIAAAGPLPQFTPPWFSAALRILITLVSLTLAIAASAT
jgi:hypothetical protein